MVHRLFWLRIIIEIHHPETYNISILLLLKVGKIDFHRFPFYTKNNLLDESLFMVFQILHKIEIQC